MPWARSQQPSRVTADGASQQVGVGPADVDEALEADAPQARGGDRAHAPQRVDRQPLQERLDAFGRHDGEPVGLLPPRGDLRQELVGRDTRGGGQSRRGTDLFLEAPGDVDGERFVPRVLGDVEVRLVERERLHQRGDGAEEAEHGCRYGAVLREVGRDNDEVRAEADAPGPSTSRPDAEGARLVAGRRHHAAPLGPAADRDRLAPQLGPIALFDGRVERVHVDVDDAAHGKKNTEDRRQRTERPSRGAVAPANAGGPGFPLPRE